ncbi:MAG TPA: hypothetical protein VFQ23_14735, partial [Anaerolineales bacterium]|nr:hypothetical protein [Anaerolineales bacterium]
MVNDTTSTARLLRVIIIALLIFPVMMPKRARALTRAESAGESAVVQEGAFGISRQGRQDSGLLAPLAGILPPSTPFLPSVLVNTIDTSVWDHPSSDPAGIAYQASTGKLLISDIDVEETPQTFWEGFNIFQSTLTGSLSGNCTTFTSTPLNLSSYNNFSDEPAGITINNSNNHIFFSDDNASRIFEVAPGTDGVYCTSDDVVTYVAVGVPPYSIPDTEDLAYGQNKIYITSAGDGNKTIYTYDLGANGVLGGGDDSSGPLPSFSTDALGFGDTEGIAFNSVAGTLYILSTTGPDTYLGEVTTSGTLLTAYDLTYLGSANRSGLTVAPASGDPSTNNIYIVSRGKDNGSATDFNDGKIWEIDITNPVMPDMIFKDGFESGNFSAWTSSTINTGNLNVDPSAALLGSYGMRAQIINTIGMEVTDDRPTLEKHYRARFYFDPNSIMLNGDIHNIFQGQKYDPYTSSPGAYNTTVFAIQFQSSGGVYQIRGRAFSDTAAVLSTGWQTMTDAPHFIEVEWSAATAAGANNGNFWVWLDNVHVLSINNIDNDTRVIDRARLGPTSVIAFASGTYYFDAFESRRQSYIGPVVSPTVLSVLRAGSNPTSASSVNYAVTFSESVTGVDSSDFQITPTVVTGATVSGVSGSSTTYTVTVNTGTGTGSLRLDVVDNDTIKDSEGNFLVGGFSTGESYTIVEDAAVAVNIAQVNAGNFNIPVHTGDRYGFPGVDNGPAEVRSTNGVDILPALRVIWREPGIRTSYSEMMGLPVEQLSSEYWFPWYNNMDVASMDQGFRIANVDTVNSNTVEVWVGTSKLDTVTLTPGESIRKGYAANNGPARVVCTSCNPLGASDRILAALRVIWKEPGSRYSYSEMMGLPVEQLSTEYWYPWYNNLDVASMDQGFRIAIVNGSGDNTVQVLVGGVQVGTNITLVPGASVRVGYPVNDGPVQVRCTTCSGAEKIITSLRVIWKEPGFRATYSEMMGMPLEQLSTTYWFPWYNNADVNSMDQGFRIAIVNGSGDNTVQVFVAGALQESITLTENESVRVGYNA